MDDRFLVYYVDDHIDPLLEDYLTQLCVKLSKEYEVEVAFDEFTFDPHAGLEPLIQDANAQRASTIVIDSRLFEAENASEGMFTGESLRLLLRRFLPFSDVLVISQQPDAMYEDFGIYKKVNPVDLTRESGVEIGPSSREEVFHEYDGTLKDAIRHSVEASIQFRKIAEKVNDDGVLKGYGIEKAIDSLLGVESYRNITSEDIDELVACFKDLKAAFGS